jgi:phosphatidylglycerol---prolipoprotein diacylglyceryl transferase
MLTYPDIDPVLLQIGGLKIHWYGVMYLLGFTSAWWLGVVQTKREWAAFKTSEQVSDLIFYAAMGVVLGGRLGYVLFYNLPVYIAHPLDIFKIWQGGMSFHGGLIGVLIAMYLYGRHQGKTFFQTTDFIAPLVPLGLLFGRIGNFINGELWGAPTNWVTGMIVPFLKDNLPHHPSQLYEGFLEGLVLFVVLWIFASKPRPTMAISGLFLVGYGFFRFVVEFVRLPDAHIGYLMGEWLTMGHLLTLPMLIAGSWMLWQAYRKV